MGLDKAEKKVEDSHKPRGLTKAALLLMRAAMLPFSHTAPLPPASCQMLPEEPTPLALPQRAKEQLWMSEAKFKTLPGGDNNLCPPPPHHLLR